MKKILRKRWQIRDVCLFSLSLVTTLAIFGGGILYFFSGFFGIEPIRKVNDEVKSDTLPKLTYLVCLADTNTCYELQVDFHKTEAVARRLYLDTESFQKGGLSEFVKTAEKLGGEYNGAFALTETQLAAVIDYVGGVSCNVDKRISAICGGITLGYGNIAGISAIRIYAEEKENELLCLSMTEELLNKWCLILSNKRSFFRLLDLSENNLSYADYLPIAEYFDRFKK